MAISVSTREYEVYSYHSMAFPVMMDQCLQYNSSLNNDHVRHARDGGRWAYHKRYTQQTGTRQDTGSSQKGLFAQILVRHSQHKSMAIVWLR